MKGPIILCILAPFIFAQDSELAWDEVIDSLQELPQRQQEAAKKKQLTAELNTLASSYQPQVDLNFNANRTTNPVGVFSGRLGNGEFRMEDFGIFMPDGTVDTTPVNHPDAYSDAVFSVQMGYRIWDGRNRYWQKRQLSGYLDAQDLREHHIWYEILVQYAERRIELDTLRAQVSKAHQVVLDSQRLVELLGALVEEGQLPRLSVAMGQTTLSQSEAVYQALLAKADAAEKSFAAWLAFPEQKIALLPSPPRLDPIDIMKLSIDGLSFAERSAQSYADAEANKPKTVIDYWQPTVDGFAAYENHQLSEDNWTVGLKATWKLWDGRAKKHQRAKLIGEAEQARASQEQTNRRMQQARARLRATLEAMQSQVEALERATETAEEAWRIHSELLAEGQLEQGTVFEIRRQLLETEQKLLAAESHQQVLCWRGLLLNGQDLERYLTNEEESAP